MLLHGEGADDVPLGVQFSRASAAHAALQASPPALSAGAEQAGARAAARALMALSRDVEAAALFSPNETVEEVATADLKYLLVAPYLAAAYARLRAPDGWTAAERAADAAADRLHLQGGHAGRDAGRSGKHERSAQGSAASSSGAGAAGAGAAGAAGAGAGTASSPFGGDRTPVLREALLLHSAFLERCDALGVVPDESRAAVRREGEADPTTRRAEKIARHRRDKATREALEALRGRRKARDEADEEVDDSVHEAEERELWLLTIDAELHRSMDARRTLQLELEMLAHARRAGALPGAPPPGEARAPPPPPVDALKHSASALAAASNDRARLAAGVFRPSHALPTMSLAEFAEQEMADARRREEESKKAEAARQAVDLDREEDHEREQQRLRSWDDWKDDNKRGSGNLKGKW